MIGEVDASFMVPSTSSCQHGPPSLIRVRPSAVPRPRRYFAALRLPCSIGGRSGSPRRQPTTGRVLVLDRPHAHPPAHGAQEQGSPALLYRFLPWRFGASPGYWVVLLRACPGQTPRRADRRLTPLLAAMALLPAVVERPLGTRNISPFEAAIPQPARLRTYASPARVATDGARLATGLPGSALAGRVSHPLDDIPNF